MKRRQRIIFEPKKRKVAGNLKKVHNQNFYHIICLPVLLKHSNQGGLEELGVWDAWKRRAMTTGY